MDDTLSFRDLWQDSRAKVYLLWAGLTTIGYVATHYYQDNNINFVWFGLSAVGFWYMYKVMPLGVTQMKRIYTAWLVPISIGIAISIVAVQLDIINDLIPYLGVFWLLVQAVGFTWNGLVDRPGLWYYLSAGLCIGVAVLCYFNDVFLSQQYLVAAIVTAWCMLNLWIFRTEI